MIILLILGITGLNARNRWVSGTVSDENGQKLIGVSVVIKGSTRGTVTDARGHYQIALMPKDSHLQFSMIAFETVEVEVGTQSRIDVVMAASASELEEVVVTDKGSVSLLGRFSGHSVSRNRRMMKTASPMAYADCEMVPLPHNTENYASIHENGFKDVLRHPLSTFSVDVDRASYANVRRFLNAGQRPPADAVRIEELINYFDYDYPEPVGSRPLSVYTELSVCPWNTAHHLLHVGLQGKHIDKRKLPASNLVFLIDVSGSMSSANKLPLLKRAYRMLVKELRPEDRVAIVVYAGAAGMVLESTPGNKKEHILQALDMLEAGGSTAGGAGLKLAYKVAQENYIEGGNNRIVLASDGDFNVGLSSNSEMERLVEAKRKAGVFLTVLGFGMGNYKDDRMELIADKGNGNYAYIDNIQEARKVLISEFGGTLFTIARDVKFQLEFNPARVKGYRLVGYENRLLNDEDFNDDSKDAGEIGAGHTVTALYELIPAGSEEELKDIDPLKYQLSADHEGESRPKADPLAELLTVKLRYKAPDAEKSTKMEIPVQGKLLDLDKSSDAFRFSAAVATFGMLLRESDYCKKTNMEEVLAMARKARGKDEEGYRAEFIRLAESADEF